MDSPAKPVIGLFGASGKTGRQFLTLALQQGYPVRALARQPDQLPPAGPQLTVVPGDVCNPDDVDRVIAGAGVVVSVFGQVKGSPPTVQTDGTRHIVAAMQRHGVAKIISLSGGGLPFRLDQPTLLDRLIRGLMRLLVPQVLRDAAGHAQVLQQSDRQWVIVRAPPPDHGPGHRPVPRGMGRRQFRHFPHPAGPGRVPSDPTRGQPIPRPPAHGKQWMRAPMRASERPKEPGMRRSTTTAYDDWAGWIRACDFLAISTLLKVLAVSR